MEEKRRGWKGHMIGEENKLSVWAFMQRVPDATVTRISAATGISRATVTKAVQAIRAGWTPNNGGK